jgi:hypothetical protein
MKAKAIAFAVIGALVAVFYGLESALSFQENGFTAPLLVKLGICGAGAYLFVQNLRRARAGAPDGDAGKAG